MLGRSFLQLKEVQEKFVQNIFTLSSLKSAEEGTYLGVKTFILCIHYVFRPNHNGASDLIPLHLW